MLAHPNITVKLNTDFFDKKSTYLSNYAKIIYTGEIDKFFDYKFGQLEYRSLRFKTIEKILKTTREMQSLIIQMRKLRIHV